MKLLRAYVINDMKYDNLGPMHYLAGGTAIKDLFGFMRPCITRYHFHINITARLRGLK